MEIIRHRVNRIEELRMLDLRLGVEFDVRSRDGELVLAHDPHQEGDPLEPYLKAVSISRRQGTLIFNPKEDGLEREILLLAERYRLRRFFLLDLPQPTLVRLAVKEGRRELAVRVSEYEPAASALRLAGKARWAWVDCFTGAPPRRSLLRSLRLRFKVCLVSPELQGYPAERIARFRALAADVDAVCTKHPEAWRR